MKFGKNVEFAQCPNRPRAKHLSEGCGCLLRNSWWPWKGAAEGIAEDEKADQQNDNSQQHKMTPEIIWGGFEKHCDFAFVHEAWKGSFFPPNEVSFRPPNRQLIRLIRILRLPSNLPDSCQQTVWLCFVYSTKFWRFPTPYLPCLNSPPAEKRVQN